MKKHLSLSIVIAVLSFVYPLAYVGSGPQWACPGMANQAGCCQSNTCVRPSPGGNSCGQLSPVGYSTCQYTGKSGDNCKRVGTTCCSSKEFTGGACNPNGTYAGTPLGITTNISDPNGC